MGANGHPEALRLSPLSSPTDSQGSKSSPSSKKSSLSGSIVAGILLVAFALIFLQQEAFIKVVGLSGGESLLAREDLDLGEKLQTLAANGPYTKCKATSVQAKGMLGFTPAAAALPRLRALPMLNGAIKGNKFIEMLIQDTPCWGNSACCQSNVYIRPGKREDLEAFQRIYQQHELAYLYPIFANYTPHYILEAGAGPGFVSKMFKLIFPRAVLVTLESQPANFENLMFNTREIDGVHAVHAGLWPYQTTLKEKEKKDTDILQEAKRNKVGLKKGDVIGLSINNLRAMFDIPIFDFVYLDIEGAEALVLNRRFDLQWLSHAHVIAVKLHEKMAKYFGAEASNRVLSTVSAAVAGRGFKVVDDGTHLILISPEMYARIPGLEDTSIGGGGSGAREE